MKDIIKFNVTDAAIKEMENNFMALSIKDVSDKEGFKKVHDARMVVKGKRVDVEKARKEMKADALEYGRKVDAEARRITGLLEPIENHLTAQETAINEEKKRIAEAKEKEARERLQKRVEALQAVQAQFNINIISTMNDTEFSQFLCECEIVYKEAEKAKKEEAERLEQQRLEQEKIRKEQEAREAAIKAERDRIAEQQRLEQEKIRKEREAIEAEKKAIADEKAAAERERLHKIEIEKAKKEAAAKAKREAEEKAKREAQAKIDAEIKAKKAAERKERLKPDKQKISEYLKSIPQAPKVNSKQINEIVDDFNLRLSTLLSDTFQLLKNL